MRYKPLIWLICTLMVKSTIGLRCPSYCQCYMNDGYKFVDCSNKGIISVDLNAPRSTEWIQLNNNSIRALNSKSFQVTGLTNIVILDLSHNALQFIAFDAFDGLHRLRHLDLSNNHLYHVDPTSIEFNVNLIHLSLSSNPLKQMNIPFLISKSLRDLDVSNCRLGHVPDNALSGLPSLLKLNISWNQLIIFNKKIIEPLKYVYSIDLSYNKFSCNSLQNQITEVIASRNIFFSTYPCEIFIDDITTTLKPVQKFEKMVEAPKVKYENPLSELEEFNDDVELVESTANPQNTCSCEQIKLYHKNKSVSNELEEGPGKFGFGTKYHSLLIGLVSYLAGFLTGVLGVVYVRLTWIWCCRKNTERHHVEQSSLFSPSQEVYDYPPPAYSDIYSVTSIDSR